MAPRPPTRFLDRGHLIFSLGLFIGSALAVSIFRLAGLHDRDLELVRAVRDLAVESFVSEVDGEELVDDALRGMLESLDRHSRFYGPEEISQIQRETSGEFRGLGVVFRPPSSEGQILFTYPDTPAARAGLEVGDTILALNGELVADLEPGGLQDRIQKAPEEGLPARVLALDGAERELVLHPERVVDPTVRHIGMIDRATGVGYLAIVSFSHRTPEEFDRAVRTLEEEGMGSLIVDLRSNPGGILDAAVRIVNRFVPEGAIVITQTRDGTRVTEARSEEADLAELPLVLLVDGGSASASEVVAGALQDHSAAVLVGVPTYGKGTVQTLSHFEDDRAIVKLTTARYFTPAGRLIERDANAEGEAGIAPDLLVDDDLEAHRQVLAYLASYSPPTEALEPLRAWERESGLELVPEHPPDTQLDAALGLLTTPELR